MSDVINPFINYPDKKQSGKNIFIDILQSLVAAISLALFLYHFVINPNEVDGPSMEPTFYTGDLLFTSKLNQWFHGTQFGDAVGLDYSRGDVVVFQIPGLEEYLKRIIAVPGDSIAIENGKFIVNGKILTENNFDIKNSKKIAGKFLVDGAPAIIVPDGSYFVSGDNRDVSYDSRELGLIKKEWMKGKVILRFWPLNKFGAVLTGEFDEANTN